MNREKLYLSEPPTSTWAWCCPLPAHPHPSADLPLPFLPQQTKAQQAVAPADQELPPAACGWPCGAWGLPARDPGWYPGGPATLLGWCCPAWAPRQQSPRRTRSPVLFPTTLRPPPAFPQWRNWQFSPAGGSGEGLAVGWSSSASRGTQASQTSPGRPWTLWEGSEKETWVREPENPEWPLATGGGDAKGGGSRSWEVGEAPNSAG